MKQKLTQLFDHLVAQALHPTTPADAACKYAREAAYLATQIGAMSDDETEAPTGISSGWIPISKQKPPRMEETPETNGFFLLLRHNPPGQYRLHLWSGSVPIDSAYWARVPTLPNNATPEPVGVVIPDCTAADGGSASKSLSPPDSPALKVHQGVTDIPEGTTNP